MTITDLSTAVQTDAGRFKLVAFDLYRDIHKGIRAELFSVTQSAGQTDPSDRGARAALAAHVRDVSWLLESHAEHEDATIQPLVELHVPEVAEQVEVDHAAFETRFASAVELADAAVDAPAGNHRWMQHVLYLDLAGFTGKYLAHQELEERVIMPGLEAKIGVDAVVQVHQALVGAIPPQDMARALAIMLPAMNVEDRVEMLGGMKAGAPPEVFEGVWSLAGSVLDARDRAAVAARLGLA